MYPYYNCVVNAKLAIHEFIKDNYNKTFYQKDGQITDNLTRELRVGGY